jgi:hypothetical protein
MIVELEVLVDPVSGLPRRVVLIEINLFIFEASPESLSENVVDGPTFAIHADLDVSGDEPLQIAIAGKVAPLITVEDDGERRPKSPIHSLQNEWHLQRLIEGPGDHVAGIPVHDCDEVHPAFEEADVGNIDAPNMVRKLRHDIPKEIGVDLIFECALADIGAGMDPFEPHVPHRSLDGFPPDGKSFSLKNSRDPAAPIKRPLGIDFVDPVTKTDLLFGWRSRPVVESRARDPDQCGLFPQGKIGIPSFHKATTLAMAQFIPDFFFNQVSWVVR